MAMPATDKKAPMASAPMKYKADGTVDWGNMWDSFCALAQDGGPPHRGTRLYAPRAANGESEGYRRVVQELVRGIQEVSGLQARPADWGWLAIACPSPEMAQWLADAVNEENVEARAQDNDLLVPVGETFTLKGEIKNVITAVAKTTHYWEQHVPPEVKRALRLQVQLRRGWQQWGRRFRTLMRK